MTDFNISLLNATGFWSLLSLFIIWSLTWKGLALWHSAKRDEKIWFIVLLLINLGGILEIIYLVFIAKIFTKAKPAHQTEISPTSTPSDQ